LWDVIIYPSKGKIKVEVKKLAKRKADPSTIGLESHDTEGQGTTNVETGGKKKTSSRKKNRKS